MSDWVFLRHKTLQCCAHLNLQECRHENRQKRAERCPLPSSFAIRSRRKWASVCGGAVMWFQCLSPHGIIPSGGKPLRLCWRITPPIINSRSALSFLFHFSSFLLTLHHFCLSWLLVCAPSSFTSAHLQHFPPNLQSQQPFLPSFFVWPIVLFYSDSLRLMKEIVASVTPAEIWTRKFKWIDR